MNQVIIGGTIVLWAAPRWRRALYRVGLRRHHRWLGDVGRSARITAASNDILEVAREWSKYRREYGTTFRNVAEIAAALRERDITIARVRELHVRNQDGSWTCGDWECEKCTLDDGHHGPVCDTCSFSTDDDIVPSVVFWPCPTVQIIDNLPAPGLRAALEPRETE